MRGRRETLLEYLFRNRLLRERSTDAAHAKTLAILEESKIAELMQGEGGEGLKLIERFVVDNSSLPPESILLRYGDEFCSRLIAVEKDPQSVIDVAQVGRKVANFSQYLSQVCELLPKTLAHRSMTGIGLTFREIQRHKEWVQVRNLLGAKLRLADVTPARFNFVLEQALEYYASHGSQILNLLFFGSRVMTRPEVVRRQPYLLELLPLEDNGFVKSYVRLHGLKLSNWQIRFVYDRQSYPFGDLTIEKHLYRDLRQRLNFRFGVFPVSALLIGVHAGASVDEQFQAAMKEMERKGKFGDPIAQYASLSDQEWWNPFPPGSGRLPRLEKLWATARASTRGAGRRRAA